MSQVCEHGASTDWWWAMMTGGGKHVAGWAGPVSTCRCCGAEFGFLESGNYGGGHSWGERWEPRDLCQKCGGRLVEWGEKPPSPASGIAEMERRAEGTP
jgi:hypothetical protein